MFPLSIKIISAIFTGIIANIIAAILLRYWIRKLFVSDSNNDFDSKKNVFVFPKSFFVTGILLTILLALISVGFHILAYSENENFHYVSMVFAGFSLLGIYMIFYSKFYTLCADPIGLTERVFTSNVKKIAWSDIQFVKFNRFSGSFVFIGYPYPEIKVSYGIKNFNVFYSIFTDKLSRDMVAKALEDFRKYQKNLSI
ncbi:hypothetical protein [Leptospira yasudae]|uniref:Uncharacterized protein n=1 Tax=Leptospira yasudae TaxID=2202201 RepID=A0A6N4QL94_9LEPT|nr:hypothetical protein [Leptospira yasudae]TGL76140.1 hypothetical protein EHQ77_19500 [Leptospira yasudae]TGL79291.1 hypothetical protein EHQ83_18820 [Leptospira yasudae]TGL82978.1 hypothetical protein EHQ72_03395 [Leptospira yasudae]